MQIAHGEWSMACAALLGNCLGKCYSAKAKILPGTLYSTAESIDFQPSFNLLIKCKCNLCSLSWNKWSCHRQTIYSSFWRRQEELATPQLLQAPGGQAPWHVLWSGKGDQSCLKRSRRLALCPVWLGSKSAAPMQNSAVILLEFSQGSMEWIVRVSGSRNGLCLICLCKQVVNLKPNSELVCSI